MHQRERSPKEYRQAQKTSQHRLSAKLYDKTAGWLIAALVATILAFFAATTFAQLRTAAIHELATQMATVTAPSIEELAQARGDLRRIETLMTIYLSGKREGQRGTSEESEVALREIDRVRGSFVEHVAGYMALPAIAGEAGLRQQIEFDAKRIDGHTRRIIELAEAGELEQARDLLQNQLIPEAEAAGLIIVRAIDLNGDKVRESANAIESSRKSTARIAFGLDGLCVVFAAAAGFVAFQGIRRYTSLIEEQRRRLELHNEELEMFAMRVAHDIRGPLTPVIMALQVGCKEAPSESARKTFEAASRSVRRVNGLVDGLLHFARAGAVPEQGAHCEPAAVLHGVLEDVAQEAEAAKVELHLDIQPVAEVRCDSAVLASVVSNLVRNAVKFMGDAPVRKVTVFAREVDGKALIEVIDTGPGLSEELAARIFEPYVRAPGTSAPGIGLGLATVKRLVVAHGGQVGVESRRRAGARFWIELPLAY